MLSTERFEYSWTMLNAAHASYGDDPGNNYETALQDLAISAGIPGGFVPDSSLVVDENRNPVSAVIEDPLTGFRVMAFKNDVTGERILAFAGTQDLQDAFQDGRLGWDQWTKNAEDVQRYLNRLADEGNATAVHFTGHSLGGALAQYAVYDFMSTVRANFPKTQPPFEVTVTTFNALGGIDALIEYGNGYDPSIVADVEGRHYFVEGDFVSRLGGAEIGRGHLGGETYRIESPFGSYDLISGHVLNPTLYYLFGNLDAFDSAVAAAPEYLPIADLQKHLGAFLAVTNLYGPEVNTAEVIIRLPSAITCLTLYSAHQTVTDGAGRGQVNALFDALGENLASAEVTNLPGWAKDLGQFLIDTDIEAVLLNIALAARGEMAVIAGASLLLASIEDITDVTIETMRQYLPDEAKVLLDGLSPYLEDAKPFLGEWGTDALEVVTQMFGSQAPESPVQVETILGGSMEEGGQIDLEIFLNRPAEDSGFPLVLVVDDPDSLTLSGDGVALVQERDGVARYLVSVHPGEDSIVVQATAVADTDLTDELVSIKATTIPFSQIALDGLEAIYDVAPVFIDDPGLTAPTNEIVGDYQWLDLEPTEAGLQDSRNSLGNRDYVQPLQEAPDQEDVLLGGAEPDALYGRGGRDVLYAWHGFDPDTLSVPSPDHLYGGDGGDLLISFAGDDVSEGGSGSDLIIDDYNLGGTWSGGNDRLYGDHEVSLGQAIADGNAGNGSGARGDFIAGMEGHDLAVGSRGDDLLSGGSGEDMLIGGAGGDFIYGDSDWLPVVGPPRAQDWGAALNPLDISQWSLGGFDWQAKLNVSGEGGMSHYDVTVSHARSRPAANPAADLIYAGAGDDFVNGNEGNDLIWAERGSDIVFGDVGDDTVQGGAGDDEVNGDNARLATQQHGSDFLAGGGGNDRVFGGAKADVLSGGDGNDYLEGDSRDEDAGDDRLSGQTGDDVLLGAAGADTLSGGAGTDQIYGDASNVAPARQGNDLLDGGAGDDLLVGGGGTDSLRGGDGADTLGGDASGLSGAAYGDDYLDGNAGTDVLIGSGGADVLLGGADADELYGDAADVDATYRGDDLLDGGAGDDLLIGDAGEDQLYGGTGADTLDGDASGLDGSTYGDDYLDGGLGTDVLIGNGGSDVLLGGADADKLYGDASDVSAAEQADDTLDGGDGADTLAGFAGNDILLGGAGDDTLYGNGSGLTGNQGDDDYLDGGTGNDILAGSDGSDALAGGAGDDFLFAGAGDDTLDGGAGFDVLSGGGGDDRLAGGAGLDLYQYAPGDGVVRITDSGSNTLRFGAGLSAGDIRLGLGSLEISFKGYGGAVHIEGFDSINPYQAIGIDRFEFADGTVLSFAQLIGRGFDFRGTAERDVMRGTGAVDRLQGLGGNDQMIGLNGADVLDGGSGADWMQGKGGDDQYLVDDSADLVIEVAGEGEDQVQSSIDFTLGGHVEELTLVDAAVRGTGNALDNRLSGNDRDNVLQGLAGADTLAGGRGADLLDGGAGADTLAGGAGDDSYLVDDAGEVIAEAVGGGYDTVDSTVSYQLQNEVEDLRLIGPNAIEGTGNQDANRIDGNAQNNRLRGNDGDDTLFGAAGADALLGGRGADNLRGGTGDDRLIGGAGSDRMAGGAGDDTYVADGADTVSELAGAGMDSVESAASYTLGANLERLVLTQGDIGGTGNTLDNVLIGSDGANVLDGKQGADSLRGGQGDDTYRVEDAQDSVIEASSAGTDHVMSSVNRTLSENIENLTLTGDALVGRGNDLANVLRGDGGDNALYGAAGGDRLFGEEGIDALFGGTEADYLDGGVGADRMSGGTGNDTYIVDDAADVANEQPGAGRDVVRSSASYSLAAEIEDLYLIGTGNSAGTGNRGDNRLYGNSAGNALIGAAGNDTLDGGYGIDRMAGGAGDDRYIVDSAGDAVVEAVGGGNDSVESAVTRTLASNVENLELTGANSIDGCGNALDNHLVGNDERNALTGMDGDDRIDAAAGNDVLLGNSGNDYLYGGDDAVRSGEDGEYVEDGEYSAYDDGGPYYDGSYDEGPVGYRLAPNDDYLDGGAGKDHLDGGSGDDELWGREGDDYLYGGDESLVGADIVYGGSGRSGNDRLYGNAGADFLSGGLGEDILDGGTGIDEMHGGSGDDVYYVDGYREVIQSPGDGDEGDTGERGNDDDDSDGCRFERKGNEGVGNGEDPPPPGHDRNWNDGPGTSPGHPGRRSGIHLGEARHHGHGSSRRHHGWDDDHDDDREAPDFAGCGDHAGACAKFGDFGVAGEGGGDNGSTNESRTIWHTDTVVEAASDDVDSVYSSATFVLPEQVENLTLIGSAAIDATGNDLDNRLAGNAAANRLDGGAGADLLIGGAGDDTYVIDNSGDVVRERSAEGADTVLSAGNYALGVSLENLILTGTAASGSGNAAANWLRGNEGDNTLAGLGGNDLLQGGGGADRLCGGAGEDTYVYRLGDGLDRIEDVNGTNTLRLEGPLSRDNVIVRRSTAEGVTTVHVRLLDRYGNEMPDQGVDFVLGADGRLPIARVELEDGDRLPLDELWAVSAHHAGSRHRDRFTTGRADDSFALGRGNDRVAAGAGRDTVYGGRGRDRLFGEASDDRLFGGMGADRLDGGMGFDGLFGGQDRDALFGRYQSDLLLGGAGDDSLDGGAGNDILAGGAGDDRIRVWRGNDVVLYNAGDGRDRIGAQGDTRYTVSLGGAFSLDQLRLSRARDDLVLNLGGAVTGKCPGRGRGHRDRRGDAIIFEDWFDGCGDELPQVTLQLVMEASAEFDAGSPDPLRSKPVQRFDFDKLAQAFEHTGGDRWSLTESLLDAQLDDGQDGLIGGELAHQYALGGGVGDPSTAALVDLLADPGLGKKPQGIAGQS